MGSKSSSTNSADGEFAAALKATQFFLVYQPTIDLETNAFAGVEALIRWRHPSRGVLSPVDFIEELEDSGAIVSVGRWAMQTACSDGASWHDKGYRFNVSVNVSPRQFSDPGFIDDVSKALDVSRFDPALFVLEFAQGTLAGDRDAARERISLLRKVGVRIAIDDFGPRESALDEVEEFEIDIVKLRESVRLDARSLSRVRRPRAQTRATQRLTPHPSHRCGNRGFESEGTSPE